MKRVLHAVNAIVAGFLATLVVATGAILVLMFSTRDAGTRATGLFGAVYFEASDQQDGSMSLELGIENWAVFVALWAVFSGLAFAIILAYGWLRRYKQALTDRGPDVR